MVWRNSTRISLHNHQRGGSCVAQLQPKKAAHNDQQDYISNATSTFLNTYLIPPSKAVPVAKYVPKKVPEAFF